MRLRSLELRNYRRYSGHHEIAFPEGIVGLLGPNGAGKSTLIEALAWAFYGQAAARTPAEGLRSSGVAESEPLSVAVEFELTGELYRVVRTLKGKNLTPEALFYRGNEQLAEGAMDVSRAVAKRLGLDWRSFYTTIFTRQKELDAFSALTSAERKGMVERLLGISLLDEVVRRVRETNRDNAGRLEDRRNQTTDEEGRSKVESLQARKEKLQELKARLAEENADLDASVQKARASLKESETAWMAAQRQKESHHDLEKHLAQAQARAHTAQETLKTLRQGSLELEAKELELEQCEPKMAGLPGAKEALAEQERWKEQVLERDRLEEELEQIDAEVKKKKEFQNSVAKELEGKPDPSQQLQRLANHRQDMVKTRDELVHKVGDLQGKAKALEGQSSSIRLHLQQIDTLGAKGNCPTCERPLKEHQPNLVAKYRKQLDENSSDKAKLKVQIEVQEKELEVASQGLKELNLKEQRYNSIKAEGAVLRTRLEALENDLTGLNERIKRIRNDLSPLAKVAFHKEAYEKSRAKVEQLQKLAGTVEELRRVAVPLLADMHGLVERATDDLDRVEDLLDTADGLRESAGRIGSTIETAATLSSSPLVRFVGMVARLRSRGRGG